MRKDKEYGGEYEIQAFAFLCDIRLIVFIKEIDDNFVENEQIKILVINHEKDGNMAIILDKYSRRREGLNHYSSLKCKSGIGISNEKLRNIKEILLNDNVENEFELFMNNEISKIYTKTLNSDIPNKEKYDFDSDSGEKNYEKDNEEEIYFKEFSEYYNVIELEKYIKNNYNDNDVTEILDLVKSIDESKEKVNNKTQKENNNGKKISPTSEKDFQSDKKKKDEVKNHNINNTQNDNSYLNTCPSTEKSSKKGLEEKTNMRNNIPPKNLEKEFIFVEKKEGKNEKMSLSMVKIIIKIMEIKMKLKMIS